MRTLIEQIEIPTGLNVLCITAYAYTIAFIFQYTYLHHFDISYRAIDINIPTLIISLAAVTLLLFMLDNVAHSYRHLISSLDEDKPTHRFIKRIIRTAVIVAFLWLLVFSLGVEDMLFFTEVVLAILLLDMVEPFLGMRKGVGVEESIKRMYEKKDKKEQINKQPDSYTYKYGEIIIVASFLAIVSAVGGKIYAMQIENVYVIHSKEDMKTVLIQKNGDTLITKKYNMSSKRFEPGFTLERLKESQMFEERANISSSNR